MKAQNPGKIIDATWTSSNTPVAVDFWARAGDPIDDVERRKRGLF